MDRDHTKAPAYWVEELARADEDIAHRRTFPVTTVLDELRAELAGLEAEMETEAEAPATDAPAR